MSESTLSVTRADLESKVGSFLGYGRGAAKGDRAWSPREQSFIDDCVESGISQAYYPPILDGAPSQYSWSFLEPTVTLTLPSGEQSLTLPDDYRSINGEITVSTSGTTVYCPVRVTGEGKVRQMYSETPGCTGRPLWASVRPLKGTTATRGQRFELYVFPEPDQDYTLQFAMQLLPDVTNGQHPYCYGGAQHRELFIESCLAIAEQRQNDAMGVHSSKFMVMLAASIGLDRKSKQQVIGYNGDRSDGSAMLRNANHYQGSITYNGSAMG